MPGDIMDMVSLNCRSPRLLCLLTKLRQAVGQMNVDQSLGVHDGDPGRRMSHAVEPAAVVEGKGAAQGEDYAVAAEEISADDLANLRRVADHIPPRAYTIAFVELVERLSYYGAVQVFVNFIQQPNPGTASGKALDPSAANAQPGALGLGQETATALTVSVKYRKLVARLSLMCL